MSGPALIVVHGAPASGKTTLVQRLRSDLHLPILEKDRIKELLYDTLEQSNDEFAVLEGRAAVGMLFSFAETFLKGGQDIVIEGAFYTTFARVDMTKIIEATGARYLEIYCQADEKLREARFAKRATDGTRHAGHLARTSKIPGVTYDVLFHDLALRVDTTEGLSDGSYGDIVRTIKQHVENKEDII